MATCLYCKKKFQATYDSETVCSRLCGSLAIEALDERLHKQSIKCSRLTRTIKEMQKELGHLSHSPELPHAFSLEFIRAVVDNEEG